MEEDNILSYSSWAARKVRCYRRKEETPLKGDKQMNSSWLAEQNKCRKSEKGAREGVAGLKKFKEFFRETEGEEKTELMIILLHS